MLGYLFFAVGIITAAFFVIKRDSKVTTNIVYAKSLASIGFVLSAVFFYAESKDCTGYLGAFTVAGAIFGLLGDIFLDLKYSGLNDSKRCTNYGFYSFLAGHLFYCIAMISAYGMGLVNYICVFAGVSLGIISVFFGEKIMKLNYGTHKKETLLYSVFLASALGLACSYTLTEHYTLHSILLNIGFLLFVISDAFLAVIYFSNDENVRTKRSLIVLNHITYYAAQYIIALSLIFYRG